MKTSNILASLTFGVLAAAFPLDKRDLVTKTEVVVETVVVYTTVWDSEAPSTVAAKATSDPGLFFEKHTSSIAKPTSVYTPSAAEPSSVYTPPAPTFSPAPSSVYTPPAPSSDVAAPSSVYTPPAPVSSAAPAETKAPSGGNGGAGSHHGDITIYDNTGAAGACGKPLTDDSKIVALAKKTWGDSTYDPQTGASTNPWCGKQITISYKHPSGEVSTTDATIMDLCPGCAGQYDIDLSHATWHALGLTEITRLQADWWVSG
ncbi:uncharacterized protein BDR25DRAFT_72736 [Lindgomyces ingoldianus]|uniref:Uncharacterized protein n=1 Tax=Lindgomyces ingoldianus TaxID=673940 RepID=A0ACB6QJ59_9PLEO|nr:uncharacterized protein BDR25DRAFT_72736 [Lindgomyces ingoldianus]KAF2467054.1 hypothetical protein BDR25DRAFT_72736 [Lindgomyces ingoldianus]